MGVGACTKGKGPAQYCRAMFSFQKIVGKGGFGRVWKVNNKRTKEVFALKVIDKARVITKKSVQSIMNQRQILSILLEDPSNFIVNIHCSFQDRQNLYLLIDYMDAGDLRYYINKGIVFNEEQVKFLMRCLMQGLSCLHRKNIIHRDIKPENIIIDQKGYAKITDLGIARFWKPQNAQETSGTPGYMAPEVLLRQNHSFCVDYYAVGVIAYELLVGKRPYAGRDRKTIREQMLGREAKIPIIYQNQISRECCDFVNRLLSRTPKKRLGYNGLSEIFNHPWLALSAQSRQRMQKRLVSSPINPLEVVQSANLQQDTQPNEVWRQNILILKRADIQKMFDGYDYCLDQSSAQKANRTSTNNSTVVSATLGNKIFY